LNLEEKKKIFSFKKRGLPTMTGKKKKTDVHLDDDRAYNVGL